MKALKRGILKATTEVGRFTIQRLKAKNRVWEAKDEPRYLREPFRLRQPLNLLNR